MIHTYSGYEKKVKTDLEQKMETLGFKEVVTNILVPEEELTEIVRGKPKRVYRKLFPAYVMLEMEATREENEHGISYKVDPRVWYEVRNTNGVTGFVGVGSDPIPMEEEEVKNMVADIEKNIGEIDILINNAGIIKRIPMTDMSVDEFNSVIDVDLIAPFIMAKAVLPSMVKRRSGKIINICSMMSELGRETVSAYAAAKGGLKMLTKDIASEYGQYNIQCDGIGPGYIATSQTAPLRKIQPDGSKHPFDSFILAKTPANRWGDPADLAGPVVFLSSPASDFVNGHILYVDGGILAYIGKQP